MADARVNILLQVNSEQFRAAMDQVRTTASSVADDIAAVSERSSKRSAAAAEAAAKRQEQILLEQAEREKAAAEKKYEREFALLVKQEDREKAALQRALARMEAQAQKEAAAEARRLQDIQKRTDAEERASAIALEIAEKQRKLMLSMGDTSKRMAEQRAKYEKDSGEQIIKDLRELMRRKIELEGKITEATNKEVRERMQTEKSAIQQEIKELRYLAQEKDAVQRQGAGASAGILGVGRELIGGAGGAMSAMLGPIAGIAAGGLALGDIITKGKEADQVMYDLKIGLSTIGITGAAAAEQLKLVSQAADENSRRFAIDDDVLIAATATYLKFGGTVDNIKQKQALMAAIVERAGVSYEMAGKMLAKSSDPEVAANLTKIGIVLDKNATPAERFQKISEKLSGTIAGMEERAKGPAAQLKQLEIQFENMEKKIGSALLRGFAPLFKVLGELAVVLADTLMPILEPLLDILGKIVGGVLVMLGDFIKKVLIPGFVEWWENIKNAVEGIKMLWSKLVGFYEWAKPVIDFWLKWLNPIGLVVQAWGWLYDKVDFVKKAIDAVVSAATSAWSYVKGVFGGNTKEEAPAPPPEPVPVPVEEKPEVVVTKQKVKTLAQINKEAFEKRKTELETELAEEANIVADQLASERMTDAEAAAAERDSQHQHHVLLLAAAQKYGQSTLAIDKWLLDEEIAIKKQARTAREKEEAEAAKKRDKEIADEMRAREKKQRDWERFVEASKKREDKLNEEQRKREEKELAQKRKTFEAISTPFLNAWGTIKSGFFDNIHKSFEGAGAVAADFGTSVVEMVVKMGEAWATEKVMSLVGLAETTATGAAAATALGAAWGPAATLASIASFGGAAATGEAALASALAVTKGLSIVPMANGGDWMVNKPTLFLAGEAGKERATFTPMRGGDAGGHQDVSGAVQRGLHGAHFVTVIDQNRQYVSTNKTKAERMLRSR